MSAKASSLHSSKDDQLHQSVSERLAGAGQRYTAGRRQLVDALAAVGRPLNMYDIMKEVPDMPQSSAYRHLTVLASSGVIHRLSGTEDSAFFELTDELSGHHHHHVMCSNCGRVDDVPSSPRLEKALADAAAVTAEQTGFQIDAHRIDLMGTCPSCL